MAATRTTARLLEAAERAGAKVVAIGDPGQLASVQAGGWLRAVGREVGALRLTEVMRQRDPGERRALAALHDRIPDRYLDWAAQAGRIDTFDDARRRARGRGHRVGRRGRRGRRRAGGDDRPRQRHPPRAQHRPRASCAATRGSSANERVYGRRELAVGDRVICRRNDALLDVDNGTRGTVRHLDEHRVVIETDSHLVRELPAQVRRRARRARLRADRPRHAGRDRRGRDRRRQPARSHRRLELHRALARPRNHAAADPRRPARRTSAPTTRPNDARQPASREELLARAGRRMLERDDEDLAIEQLPPAGRADDRQLTLALEHAGEPVQEHAALRAEPAVPARARRGCASCASASSSSTAQRAALPSSQLQPARQRARPRDRS